MPAHSGPLRRVILSCRHSNDFSIPPAVGDTVWCKLCQVYRQVALVPDEWKYKCTGCRVSQRFGSDEITCVRKAGTHLVRKPEHGAVYVFYGDELRVTITQNNAGDLLREAVSTLTYSHQKSLRAFSENAIRANLEQKT